MGSPSHSPRSTQQKLRAELDARGWGVRTLARQMAAVTNEPHRVESFRRMLKRYLAPVGTVVPTTASRYLMEQALDLDRDGLKADEEDDSEAARMSRLSLDEILQMRAELYVERAWAERIGREEMSA